MRAEAVQEEWQGVRARVLLLVVAGERGDNIVTVSLGREGVSDFTPGKSAKLLMLWLW